MSSDPNDLDERLGDLSSMSQTEQDHFSRVLTVATMGFVVVFFGAACFVALAQMPAGQALLEQELARLRGQWQSIETEETLKQTVYPPIHRLTVQGNRLIVLNDDGLEASSTFTIDPATMPKAIDRTASNGRKSIGIYKIEGETLTLCFGLDQRPRDFTISSSRDATTWVVIYKRVKK